MVDPQEPDILANWCPQCSEHTDYDTIERRGYSGNYKFTQRIDICKVCGSEDLWCPTEQKGKLEKKGCLGVILITAASLVVATLISNSKRSGRPHLLLRLIITYFTILRGILLRSLLF